MQILVAAIVGLVFGFGLIISGMADPSKVLNFLDLTGDWDPSLALVMGGAILVGLVAFRFAARRTKSVLGDPMRLPAAQQIDRRLVFGGLAFGVGWGLAGFCPGPALVSLASGNTKAVVFNIALVAGMGIFEMVEQLRRGVSKQAA